jgi:PIN domain nuclease of toxin-antitoxin system
LVLLLDTHIMVWMAAGDRRLTADALQSLVDPDTELAISAVIAWEYADLEKRGRFAGAGPLGPILEGLDISVLDFPAALWPMAASLPDIHRDPVDRMLVAHALALDMPLMSADANIRQYPGLRLAWD